MKEIQLCLVSAGFDNGSDSGRSGSLANVAFSLRHVEGCVCLTVGSSSSDRSLLESESARPPSLIVGFLCRSH